MQREGIQVESGMTPEEVLAECDRWIKEDGPVDDSEEVGAKALRDHLEEWFEEQDERKRRQQEVELAVSLTRLKKESLYEVAKVLEKETSFLDFKFDEERKRVVISEKEPTSSSPR